MSAAVAEPRYTPEEYLAIERAAEERHEYVNGRIYALAGTSRAHSLIAGNLFGQIHQQLRGGPCEAHANDLRVKVSESGLYTYPDVVAACGDVRFEDAQNDTLLNPLMIVEVLSPTTEAYDRGEKFAHYRRLESLQEYVLVSQDRMRVERHVRRGEEWVLTEYTDPDAVLDLPSINCRVTLRDIYDKVSLPDDDGRGPAGRSGA